MIRIAERFARIRPASPLRDRFRYSEALGYFHQGQLDRAIATAKEIAFPTTHPPDPSPEAAAVTSQSVALLGRIHEARLELTEAVAYYRTLVGKVPDAEDAVAALTAKSLGVPEVTVIRPARGGLPPGDGTGRFRLALDVTHRNLAELDVRVYPVDLLRLFTGVDDMAANGAGDLAGIRPVHQSRVVLAQGPGAIDATNQVRRVELPVDAEGAVPRDPSRRRPVRLGPGGAHPDGAGGHAVTRLGSNPGRRPRQGDRTRRGRVQVKVIGSRGPMVRRGETDLRGVYVADAVDGRLTVVARSGTGRYALHRSPAEQDEDRTALGRARAAGQSRRGEGEDVLHPARSKGIERRLQRMEMGGGMGGMGGGMMGGGFR